MTITLETCNVRSVQDINFVASLYLRGKHLHMVPTVVLSGEKLLEFAEEGVDILISKENFVVLEKRFAVLPDIREKIKLLVKQGAFTFQ